MKRIVTGEDWDYPIQPSDIDATKHMFGAFGNKETEVSAGYIVRHCQGAGAWVSFTKEELNAAHQKTGNGDYRFNRLLGSGRDSYVVQDGDKYRVTHEFIARCFLASPNPTMWDEVE